MKKGKSSRADELRPEYKRSDFPKGFVRGKYAANYRCRLFSRNTGDRFLDYLKSIEAEADPMIPALVRATYGEDWLKPYVTMFAPRTPDA